MYDFGWFFCWLFFFWVYYFLCYFLCLLGFFFCEVWLSKLPKDLDHFSSTYNPTSADSPRLGLWRHWSQNTSPMRHRRFSSNWTSSITNTERRETAGLLNLLAPHFSSEPGERGHVFRFSLKSANIGPRIGPLPHCDKITRFRKPPGEPGRTFTKLESYDLHFRPPSFCGGRAVGAEHQLYSPLFWIEAGDHTLVPPWRTNPSWIAAVTIVKVGISISSTPSVDEGLGRRLRRRVVHFGGNDQQSPRRQLRFANASSRQFPVVFGSQPAQFPAGVGLAGEWFVQGTPGVSGRILTPSKPSGCRFSLLHSPGAAERAACRRAWWIEPVTTALEPSSSIQPSRELRLGVRVDAIRLTGELQPRS